MSLPAKLYIGTNTKMYKGIKDTTEYLKELHKLTSIYKDDINIFVIPSFTTLESANKVVEKSFIKLGAQNMGWEEQGTFSGEISPLMLNEVGVEMVMIGHSERRHVLGETNTMEQKKVAAALSHNLTPLLCIGEKASEKNAGISAETLRIQLKECLALVKLEEASKVMIAYEPVWAIGEAGTPASSDYVAKMHLVIREALCEIFNDEVGHIIPILYGGSVNPENSVSLISQENVDGLFVGRSAWDAKNFASLIKSILPIWKDKQLPYCKKII